MVSLKMSKAEAKAEGYAAPAEPTPPEYPWGTSITLVDEPAHALFPKMPEVGAKVSLDAAAIVKSVNMVQQEGGKSRVSIELQLTDLDIEEAEEKGAPNYYGDKPKSSDA